jgi:hypothetical protein
MNSLMKSLFGVSAPARSTIPSHWLSLAILVGLRHPTSNGCVLCVEWKLEDLDVVGSGKVDQAVGHVRSMVIKDEEDGFQGV